MAGIWDVVLVIGGMWFIVGIWCLSWLLDLNNRAKFMRMTKKKNYGIFAVVGKGAQMERQIVDFADEYVNFHGKIFKLLSRDDKGNQLFIYYNGVPWMIFNEDRVVPVTPYSEPGKKSFYFCKKCKKYFDLKQLKYNEEEYAVCPDCGELIIEKKEILPISVHRLGAPTSLHNIWTLFEEDARLEAQGMLYNKLNEFGWLKWGILGLILIGIIIIGLCWTIYGDTHAIKEHLMPAAVQAAQNVTNATR